MDFHFLARSLRLASLGSLDFFIKSIIGSMFERAIVRPSKMWPLSFDLAKSKAVLLETTDRLWLKNISRSSFKFKTFGTRSTIATLFMPKEVSSWDWAYKLFKITSGFWPVLRSTTILTPSLSDSSRISDMPSIFLSFERSAIFST